MDPANLHDRLSRVRETIAGAAGRSGRDAASVRLVAITKGHSAAALRAALEAGLGEIGENRVQEALAKFGEVHDALESAGTTRHLVGPLQRNKARDAVALFDWIQSIDSSRIARAVSDRAESERAEPLPVLIEVNVAGEEQRHGFAPDETADAALEVAELPGLSLRGLMAMAPYTDDEATLRRTFASVRRLWEEVRRQGAEVDTLSMGMSNDYALAIEEGSTMIRLGTALLGPRGG
ncbi:MAG: YggS family pyridoxal phosphate-dependent enzyme [Gemmatimonadetes bacterium]|nr:YggS family pyridoxal phosphate-dependent enzyme [Gemmatimonadota bacterium]